MLINSYELGENEVLEIKGDHIFHDLWNEKEMDTIEWTVMQILDCSYEDIHGKVRVGNIRLPNLSREDKQKYVDLIVYYKDTINIIELNNNANDNYLRNTLYAMNGLINAYIEGEGYTNKRMHAILVNLNWYRESNLVNHSKGKSELIYGYPILGKENEDYLLKIINVNLEYYQKICYDETDEKDRLWKLLTIKEKEELKEVTKNNSLLKNYGNKLERLSKDKEYCRMVWDSRIDENLRNHDAYCGGYDEGIKKGIQKGIQDNKNEIVINMYINNEPIEKIIKYTNLSKEEIENIINNIEEKK